jgi:uncharacterized SAM-binding protein YcdF (DUF218 family)
MIGVKRHSVRVLASAIGLSAVAWVCGFAWFLSVIAQPAAEVGHADGIVVLTGGADRIEAGLRLLAGDHARLLLISGIGGGADLGILARGSDVDTALLAGRIVLGRTAASTRGNAKEAAAWAAENRIETMIVVTAWFHIPRALNELHRVMPGVALIPAPVRPRTGAGRPESGWTATTRLLGEEYSKYLIALTHLDNWLPAREVRTTGGRAS